MLVKTEMYTEAKFSFFVLRMNSSLFINKVAQFFLQHL